MYVAHSFRYINANVVILHYSPLGLFVSTLYNIIQCYRKIFCKNKITTYLPTACKGTDLGQHSDFTTNTL